MISRLLTFLRIHRFAPFPAVSTNDDEQYDDILSDEYLASVLSAACEPERERLEREVREMSEGVTARINRLREISGSAGLRAA